MVSHALIVININKLENKCNACVITTKHSSLIKNKRKQPIIDTSHDFPGGRTACDVIRVTEQRFSLLLDDCAVNHVATQTSILK